MSNDLDTFIAGHQDRPRPRSNPRESNVICPDCGAPMVLRETKKFKWKNGKDRLFYGCIRYPFCKATHGAHPDGRPLGIPGNAETKAARIRAHDAFDGMAQRLDWNKGGAYAWLRKKMKLSRKECHIGRFNIEQCEKVIKLCQE